MKEQNRLCSDEILFLKIGRRQESVRGPVRQPPDKGQEGGAGAGGPSVACEVERRASVTQKRETRDVWGDGCSDPDWWGVTQIDVCVKIHGRAQQTKANCAVY